MIDAWYTGVQWSFIVLNIRGEGRVNLRRDKSQVVGYFEIDERQWPRISFKICAMQGRNDRLRRCSRKLAHLFLSFSRKELTVSPIVSTFVTRDRSRRLFCETLDNSFATWAKISSIAKNIPLVDQRIQLIWWYENASQKERRKNLQDFIFRILELWPIGFKFLCLCIFFLFYR